MNGNNNMGKKALGLLQKNSVPIMFILICAICIPLSGFSVGYLANEIVTPNGGATAS